MAGKRKFSDDEYRLATGPSYRIGVANADRESVGRKGFMLEALTPAEREAALATPLPPHPVVRWDARAGKLVIVEGEG
jgi:hypothetical protein